MRRRKEAAMGKTWKGCRNCKHAYKNQGVGNLLCGLRDGAGDGFTAVTRRERAAEVGGCFHFEAKDPITDLNALPGNVPAMRAATEPAADIKTLDIDPMERPLYEIDEVFLNPFAELPLVLTWCKMGERPAIDRQGIITFSAKPKQGKSLSIYAILTAIITGKQLDTITPTASPRLVVVFDTEMDTPTLQRRAAKMITALGEAAPRFQIVPLLAVPKSRRRAVIAEVTSKYQPDIVVIDQVARLVEDFNAAGENVEFGEWLAQYAATRTALVVIHQNKAADNKQMKGHLGSILEELAVENYSVAKENGVFKVTATNARNSSVDEAAPFTFALDDDGNIISASDIVEAKTAQERARYVKDLALIFGDNDELRRKDIIDRIISEQRVTPDGAKKKVDKAAAIGAIIKAGEGRNAPYKLAVNIP